jgi:hypothetical protein
MRAGKGVVLTSCIVKERNGVARFRPGIWLLTVLGRVDTKGGRCFLCMEEYDQKGRSGERRS